MQATTIDSLFHLRSHNPSFHAVSESHGNGGAVSDFCVPVNLYFPPAEMLELIARELPQILRYYPDYADVQQRNIAAMTGLDAETIVPANGSTEIITMLCRQAAGPMVTDVPTFGRWTDVPLECGVPLYGLQREARRGFRLGVDDVVRRVREVRARTLVLSSPNNPTGQCFRLKEIQAIAGALCDLDALIVDESFLAFSDEETVEGWAATQKHVVVVKSMGKSLGWHGIRLGYAVAHSDRAREMRARLPFWNVNGLAAYVLKLMPRFLEEYRRSFAGVREDRVYLASALTQVPGLTVYPSQANFVLVRLPAGVSGRLLRNRLLEQHAILVRETSNKVGSTEQYLRLAVQVKAEVDNLDKALRLELAKLTPQPPRN